MHILDKLENLRKYLDKHAPYTGGAGPTEDGRRRLNQDLLVSLMLLGIDSATICYVNGDPEGQASESVVFKLNNKTYSVSWDRWGYTDDDVPDATKAEETEYLLGEHDQASLTTVITEVFRRLIDSKYQS
jgi:hypothetical protein